MKRFFVLLCICALLCALTACRKDDLPGISVNLGTTEDVTDSAQEITTADTSVQTEPTTEKEMLSPAEQIALISAECAQWLPNEEWYYQPYSYAVTDLNQNGRLELLVSCCQGTGIFTITDVYEVSEDGESLIYCENSLGEGASQSDLIVSQAPVYYNEESGAYTYLFSDYMRSGWAWNGEDLRAVTLTEGLLTEEAIVGVTNEYDEEANCTTTYYNAGGEVIDEVTYNTAITEFFADCVELEVLFNWLNIDCEDAYAMDAEAWISALTSSWDGFGIH